MKELLIKRGYLPVFIAGEVMIFVGAGGTYFLRNLIYFLSTLWSVYILLIMIGTILVFAGLRNIWVNAKNRGIN